MQATLLVELLTEELPPKSLSRLGKAFAQGIFSGLVAHHLKPRDFEDWRVFATPRRLGVLVPKVESGAKDREKVEQGPSVSAPPAAIAGFAKKHGIAVDKLEHLDTPKGKVVVARANVVGAKLDSVLASIVADAIKKLPIPKVMRWVTGTRSLYGPRTSSSCCMVRGWSPASCSPCPLQTLPVATGL